MKFSTGVLTASFLASLAVAQPIHHAHKREAAPDVVVTVEATHYVTVAPNGAAPTPVASAAPAPPPPAPSPVSENEVEAAPASPAPVETSVAPVASSAPAAPAASSAPAPSSDAGSAGAFGITYSPYNGDGTCKSASEVASDVSKLGGYSVLRLYGVDCNQVANVYNAKAASQKLFLGIFDVSNVESGCQSIKDGINGDWDAVDSIGIGNELVNSGQANPGQVSGYVQQARSTLRGLGYNGPVVAPDTFIAVLNNPSLCDVSDYIAINAHAFFDSTCVASNAGNWALSTLQSVSSVCNGKKTLITETGWPSHGEANGQAVAGASEQQSAIDAIKSKVGNDVILFTAFNDFWKQPGPFQAEQFYGLLSS